MRVPNPPISVDAHVQNRYRLNFSAILSQKCFPKSVYSRKIFSKNINFFVKKCLALFTLRKKFEYAPECYQ